eukprot:NODE_1874_length_1373_cov_31.248489_g1695_i0.p1 GENE.NODE_1874_length_1373_cov_31.248489_g1695_i0~~NODE_1874_length_1373_cov_31.248489_g1695_i0.p1  ORF type:complete len:406 (+),score=68.15 NODE_1874_length_1373_cov_31.248489_g1695_i0:61-1278(+)
MNPSRMYDVVLWGATGFTGQLAAQYFARSVSRRLPGLRWAIAGRNASKLADVVSQCKAIGSYQPDVLVGESGNQSSIDRIVSSTAVMLCTAGPFTLYGIPVVDACVRHRTHYVDITGETTFHKTILDRYGAEAEQSGTFIVPHCGFDSIPSDLGTFFTAQAIQRTLGQKTRRVTAYVEMEGALSGGTFTTGIVMEKTGAATAMKQPFLLGGGTGTVRPEDEDLTTAKYSEDMQQWTGPFMMGEINTRVVRRSAHLLGSESGYSQDFGYNECMLAKSESAANRLAAPMPPASKREAMQQAGRMPKAGEGPSKELRDRSWFRVTFVGEAEDGRQLRTTVSGGDAGYDETAKMVSEAAVCLVTERGFLIPRGGVLTPASAFRSLLIDKLHSQGIKFEVKTPASAASKL